LENTQFALIATVHKLYSMVRTGQQWDLGEPELNDRGQPVIHNIAQKLGCIRPNSDIDLPVHSVFPEDEAGMTELARQLEEQQQKEEDSPQKEIKKESYSQSDRASSSDLESSDFEPDYRRAAFDSHNQNNNAITLLPQSFTTNQDFEYNATPTEVDANAMFPSQSPSVPAFTSAWQTNSLSQANPNDLAMHFLQQSGSLQNMDMLSQGLLESEFGTIKPHVLSCSNPEVMMGMGDPMIYSGFDGEALRL
jgi:hypothetical protein